MMTKDEFLKEAKVLAKQYGYQIYVKKLDGVGGLHYLHDKTIIVHKFRDRDSFIFCLAHELSHMILANTGKLKKLHGTGIYRRYFQIGTRQAAINTVKDERKVDEYAKKLIAKITGKKSTHRGCYSGSINKSADFILEYWSAYR